MEKGEEGKGKGGGEYIHRQSISVFSSLKFFFLLYNEANIFENSEKGEYKFSSILFLKFHKKA